VRRAGPPSGDRRDRTETGTAGTRESKRVRERLIRVQEQIRLTRANERVLAEQVDYLHEIASDAETRGLVAETPLADREWREARTDLNRHTALLDEARREVADLLAERDRLLDRLSELETAPRRDHE
jgi:chromosome segregation ATPase